MYPITFKPSAPADLIRVGSQYDGGYILPERVVASTKGILSFGLSDNWDFEAESSRISGAPVVCFDPSVTGRFWIRKFSGNLFRAVRHLSSRAFWRAFSFIKYFRFFDGVACKHIPKAVGTGNGDTLSFSDTMALAGFEDGILLKVDIEGWEYRLLSDIIANRAKFVGIVIEFHDVDLHERRIEEFIERIRDNFVLVHFHTNSHTTVGLNGYALVVEMSFMNRSLLRQGEQLVAVSLPVSGLDAPNLPGDQERPVLFFEPRA